MPTTATYSHYYSLGTVDPRTLTDYPNLTANVANTTLTDDEDGGPDGDVALNASMSWSASSNVQLIGVTDAGYPVVVDTGFYYIITDRGDLHNTPLVVNATGYTMCFAAGTQIATSTGPRDVERLDIGDVIQTADGTMTPVKWVGRKTVHKLFSGPHMQPVRIKAGALGGGLPHADLTVTADHGMVLDGLVINAAALVNGTTIDWVPMDNLPTQVTYYHIETEHHDVILANGAETETFVDASHAAGSTITRITLTCSVQSG